MDKFSKSALIAMGVLSAAYLTRDDSTDKVQSSTGCVARSDKGSDCFWSGPYGDKVDRGNAVGPAEYAEGADCVEAPCVITAGSEIAVDTETNSYVELDRKGQKRSGKILEDDGGTQVKKGKGK